MDGFARAYPDLPRSTFFLHDSSGNWHDPRHEMASHPTLDDSRAAVIERPSGHFGVRAHSCVSSHMISIAWREVGYVYQSNITDLGSRGAEPTRTAWGLWEVPISYMDNQDLWFGRNWGQPALEPLSTSLIHHALDASLPFVVDFHPIHIALNTQSVETYRAARPLIASGSSPYSLAVLPRKVSHAGGGWLAAECGVWPVMVVDVQPAGQGGSSG